MISSPHFNERCTSTTGANMFQKPTISLPKPNELNNFSARRQTTNKFGRHRPNTFAITILIKNNDLNKCYSYGILLLQNEMYGILLMLEQKSYNTFKEFQYCYITILAASVTHKQYGTLTPARFTRYNHITIHRTIDTVVPVSHQCGGRQGCDARDRSKASKEADQLLLDGAPRTVDWHRVQDLIEELKGSGDIRRKQQTFCLTIIQRVPHESTRHFFSDKISNINLCHWSTINNTGFEVTVSSGWSK